MNRLVTMRWLAKQVSYLTKSNTCAIFQHAHSMLYSTKFHQHISKIETLLSVFLNHPLPYPTTQQLHSHLIVNGLHNHSVLLFNTLIRSYSLTDSPTHSFLVYNQFQRFSVSYPYFDTFTYNFLLVACANLCYPILGSQFHSLVIKVGFTFHVYVQTALVNMYISSGLFVDAIQVFDEMPERTSFTWNVMITRLVKWGELKLARSFFDKMPDRNVVSWTAMIDGYTRMNRHCEAIAFFREMVVSDDITPTEVTVLAIIPTVSFTGDLYMCKSIHGYVEKNGYSVGDIRISNSIVDTYSKCGCIMSAWRVFKEIKDNRKNLVSWTSIISGFAMHGMGNEAVENFKRMGSFGLKPNRVTYLSVLNACSHGALIEEGINFFNKMIDEGRVMPDIKHYGCLVDMLGRVGRLEEAENMALEIPKDIVNVVIWRTLLGACSFHGNMEMGKRVSRKIMEMEKGYGGDYVLMSNIFASSGRFKEVERLRRLLDERNAFKLPGHSFCDVEMPK